MKLIILYFLLLGILNFQYVSLNEDVNKNCTTPENEPGSCLPIELCPALKSALYHVNNDTIIPETEEFLNRSTCDWNLETGERIVCCSKTKILTDIPEETQDSFPDDDDEILLPDPPDNCGMIFTEHFMYSRIIGGFKVEKGQFPWIVAIGYDFNHSQIPNPGFFCSGSLITANHVLTAAHCVRGEPISMVRLATLNPYKDVGIEGEVIGRFVHENYTTKMNVKRNDIAILKIKWKLKSVVNFVEKSANISPICLPKLPEMRKNMFERYYPFIAGWGRLKFNNTDTRIFINNTDFDLHALQIPIWNQKKCRQAWRRRVGLQGGIINKNVICAGYTKERRDSCLGDSGGPLMLPHLVNNVTIRYYQIGIISQGFGCAVPGIPAIYVRVGNYIEWIQEKINL